MWITIGILGILVILIAVLVLISRQRYKSLKNVTSSGKIKILTDQNFNATIKEGIVLVDFWATWCMPCKIMVPVLNDLAEAVNGKVTIGKLDVDVAKKTATAFKIRSIPTMVLFKNGKEIHRFVGVKTKEYLIKELDRRTKF